MGFCEHYCVQMTFLVPVTIGKCSWGKEHPFLTEVVLIINNCFIQYNAPLVECQCMSGDKLVLPEVTGTLSFSDHFQYFWGINCYGNGTQQYSTCLCQSGSLHILSSYHYILSILGEIFLLWNQSFQGLAIVAFQLQSV